MNLLDLKVTGVFVLAAINLRLLWFGVVAYRQKGPLPEEYYRVLPASTAVALFQVGIGLFFLLTGRRVEWMHLLYGILVGAGAILQMVLRSTTAAGQQYRGKPLVHAALALFVALLAIRSWLSG
ncbi:MAG: hypothetical protein ACOY93_06220 [Bacillota bacterium]